MPSAVDERGIEVEIVGAMVLDEESIDRFVDIMIVKLSHSGVSFRDIARILNRPKSVVHDRYNTVPQEAKDYYVSLQLG